MFQNEYVERLDTFKQWKKRRRKQLWQWLLLLTISDISLTLLVIVKVKFASSQKQDLAFGVFGVVLFGWLTFYFFKQWLKSFSWKVEKCWFGVVQEKKRHSDKTVVKNKDNRGYYLSVIVEGEIKEGKCDYLTFKQVEVSEEVILFSVGTGELFVICVKCYLTRFVIS